MASQKKATHIMVHKNQYMAIGGKMQRIPVGTEVTLTGATAKAMESKGRVRKIGDQKAVDLTPDPEAIERAEQSEKTAIERAELAEKTAKEAIERAELAESTLEELTANTSKK